ncbi:hypothetical protein [Nocardia bovistercoris]|uniref:Uncharacterized protein n=1 Tax=Nocardia bovistercoris TaxID=2785916 RepID=A0A931IFA4_9NOCA|nr:hypothetical protein [Nocardia bovistercoris]MBH0780374.1 hypothetical protein [Nocardia bovistercoris]
MYTQFTVVAVAVPLATVAGAASTAPDTTAANKVRMTPLILGFLSSAVRADIGFDAAEP